MNNFKSAEDLRRYVYKQFPDVTFELYDSKFNQETYLSLIEVPKDKRRTGIGTKLMQMAVDYADRNGRVLTLSPEGRGGPSKAGLTDWYRSFGFVPNKGRNKDYHFRSAMYRRPKLAEDVRPQEYYLDWGITTPQGRIVSGNGIRNAKVHEDLELNLRLKRSKVVRWFVGEENDLYIEFSPSLDGFGLAVKTIQEISRNYPEIGWYSLEPYGATKQPITMVAGQAKAVAELRRMLKNNFGLNEGISPGSLELLRATGNKVVDQVEAGDYEMFLVYNRFMDVYQLAMQRKGSDFTDLHQQASRGRSELGDFSRKVFKDAVKKWLQQYGTLVVASHNQRKTEGYVKILKAAGFKPEMAGPFVIISESSNGLGHFRLKSRLIDQSI